MASRARRLPPLIALLLLAGCSVRVPSEIPGPSAAGPVFLVHGIQPDGVDWWVDDMEMALRRRGVEAVPVSYWCFLFGYLFGYGTDGPADRIAAFVSGMEARHARTDCPAELRFNGVGFSAGTMVLVKAAERGARFRRVYFGGSPIKLWDGDLRAVLRDGRFGELVNYYSPLDLVVIFTMGSGMYGYQGADRRDKRRVHNRLHWRHHFAPTWWDDDRTERIADEIVRHCGRGQEHTCFQDRWFREWYLAEKRRMLEND